jgi:hypothetical protein
LSSWSSRWRPSPRTTTTSSLLSKMAGFVLGLKVHYSSSFNSLYLLSCAIFNYFSLSFFFRFFENSSPSPARVAGISSYLVATLWGLKVYSCSFSYMYFCFFCSNFCFAAGLLIFSHINSYLKSWAIVLEILLIFGWKV